MQLLQPHSEDFYVFAEKCIFFFFLIEHQFEVH